MADYHLALVPVGRVSLDELEAAASRAAKVIHRPLEVRTALPVPHGTLDATRGQHRVADFLQQLAKEVLKLKPGKLVGAEDPQAKPPFKPNGTLFVTDVDLFTSKTEGAFGALISHLNTAVISVRRQREAFYSRRADPNRQRMRLTKEVLRMYGRLRGLSECGNPECVLAPTRSPRDLDTKEERFCRACEARLFEGKLRM